MEDKERVFLCNGIYYTRDEIMAYKHIADSIARREDERILQELLNTGRD